MNIDRDDYRSDSDGDVGVGVDWVVDMNTHAASRPDRDDDSGNSDGDVGVGVV